MAAADVNTAWAVGASGTILKTTNGGVLWSPQTSGTTNQLTAVTAVDDNTAWPVGAGGTILRTIDGGSSWTSLTSGATSFLTGVAATDGLGATGSAATFTTVPPVVLRLETYPQAAALDRDAVEVRIYANAGAELVDGVQLRLTYDPARLQAVDGDGQASNGVNLQPGDAFRHVVQNGANPSSGTVSLAVTRTAGQAPGLASSFWGPSDCDEWP